MNERENHPDLGTASSRASAPEPNDAATATGFWANVHLALAGADPDDTREPLRRAIFLLPVPMALELVMESVFAVADIFFVARLGVDAVATVGWTEAVITLFYAIAMGTSAAATALVARRVGEGDRRAASATAAQVIYLGVAISAVVAAVGLSGASALLRAMGGTPALIAGGRDFTAVMLGGCVTIMLLFLNNAALRGAGHASHAMRAVWLANAINSDRASLARRVARETASKENEETSARGGAGGRASDLGPAASPLRYNSTEENTLVSNHAREWHRPSWYQQLSHEPPRWQRWVGIGVAVLAVAMVTFAPPVAGAAELNEHLAPLQPYVGRTWRGTFTDENLGGEVTDVSRWESALNGQAVRILHGVDDGVYGGETIIVWDAQQESLIFYYFTTAGFYTHGSVSVGEDGFVAHETVVGNEQGISEVRSTARLLADGRLENRSEYLKDGAWVPGHAIIYTEAPEAEVEFR